MIQPALTANPIKLLLEWLRTQPQEVRTDVAVLVGPLLNADFNDLTFLADAPSPKFESWLSARIDDEARYVTSLALKLRTHIQFFVIDELGSEARWDQNVEGHKQSIERLRKEGYGSEMTEPLKKIIQSAPFRKRLWGKAAESWSGFAQEHLSIDTLRSWQLSQA